MEGSLNLITREQSSCCYRQGERTRDIKPECLPKTLGTPLNFGRKETIARKGQKGKWFSLRH